MLVTARADFQMSDYAVFDGEYVDVTVVTTREGAAKLEAQRESHAWVDIIAVDAAAAGEGVDLRQAVAALEERYGISYLLCEGGPTLYSGMLTAGLIDEKFRDRFAARGGPVERARAAGRRCCRRWDSARKMRCAGVG